MRTSLTRRRLLQGMLAGTGAAALAGTLGPVPVRAEQKAPAQGATMVFHGTGFEPMVAHLITGASLDFRNQASGPLQLASAPGAPVNVDHTVAPGAEAKLAFSKPGIYLLYDARTTRFDGKVQQVVARQNSPSFPLPAYAIVVVTDRQGRGIPMTKPDISIPDSYMTFEPWAIVVAVGAPIEFTNNDMDMHVVMPAPEPMVMPNPSGESQQLGTRLWLETMEAFAPLTLKGGGGTGIITISQPGVHHYYCPVHSAYNANAFTYAPLKSYGGYPFIMDGIIVVEPT